MTETLNDKDKAMLRATGDAIRRGHAATVKSVRDSLREVLTPDVRVVNEVEAPVVHNHVPAPVVNVVVGMDSVAEAMGSMVEEMRDQRELTSQLLQVLAAQPGPVVNSTVVAPEQDLGPLASVFDRLAEVLAQKLAESVTRMAAELIAAMPKQIEQDREKRVISIKHSDGTTATAKEV